ncbi:MAG: LLM class flavin-dependent oxidoreductase [Micropepsaceae bacterium]
MKPILLNAFQMNTVGHHAHGLWTHPRDRSRHYNELGYWLDLARTLERGCFDGIFLADVLGVYDVYQNSPAAALRNAMQIPVGDPMMLVSAMAAVTEHLSFGITGIVGFEPPYPFARRMSTLDHLTNGRVAWNIVTGYLNSAARGIGQSSQQTHDQRYDTADEFMEVVYRLWEGSWEDDAVVADKQTHVFADPAKVHRVKFSGAHYSVDAIHLCEPSLQRTPILFQAGSSERGRAFAARHAECVFVLQTSKLATASIVEDLRARTLAQGRAADDIRIFNLATVITGPDESAAQAKLADYRKYVSPESVLAVLSGGTGIDLGKFELDEPLRYEKTDAVQSILHMFQTDGAKLRTMRELGERGGIGSGSLLIVGSPTQVADELEAWIDETGIDGFNLASAVMPETFADFVEFIVPELQRRGRLKRSYAQGTLREKLFGYARLPSSHPASVHRSARKASNPDEGRNK